MSATRTPSGATRSAVIARPGCIPDGAQIRRDRSCLRAAGADAAVKREDLACPVVAHRVSVGSQLIVV